MLGGVRLKVVYAHEKTCFAYISHKYSTTNEQAQTVQVICKDKELLLWAVYSNNIPEGHLACNPMYCRLLGLVEGSTVFVSPNAGTKVLDELFIDTESPDDQEILEHNVEILQLRILDQLRLVVANQKAMVWISTSMPIVFTPKQTGLLVDHSRIIVKVDAFNSFYGSLQHSPNERPEPKDIKFNNIGVINNGILKPYINKPQKLVLRAVPIDSDGKKNLIHPYTVFIHEHYINEKYKKSPHILATVTNIPSVLEENKEDEEETDNRNNQINNVCVEIVAINNVVYRSLCHEVHNMNIPTVLIPKSLNSIIHVENGTRLIHTIIGETVEQPDHIDIITYSDVATDESDVIERFKSCVIENTHSGKQFLINHDMVKQNQQICQGYVKFKLKPEKLRYTMLNSESFRHCSVSAKCLRESELKLPTHVPLVDIYANYCKAMKSIQSLVDRVLKHIYFEIHREANFKGVSEVKSNVLITGINGSGKSSVCNLVQQNLTVWSHTLHCRSLKGRKDIPEVLAKAILMCQEHSPAVLVCDDVDALVPPNVEGASPQDIAYYQRLAAVIKHLLQSCAGVCVLMTSLSLKDLHPVLRQFNGKPLFTAQFAIPELDKQERAELIKHFLNDKIREEFTIEDDDVIKMAGDTAGGTVRDVADYFNKKIFKGVQKKNTNPEDPKPRLVEAITNDSEKAKGFNIWGPVGGMHSVKQQLIECIFWPIMYPALFPSQSCGILLYGPPGTGKSHIGSCLSRISNMNLIVVKGPELLSKYIGQSEKAVRDVFDKAEAKRPCILFFDEFDSLAPKRGHDSTGVTDRVVNQLLSRLDGAEGGAAGPVLCATSRPDLIDPALLRPGRLATHVYVPMPDEVDRLEILQTLSHNVSVSPAVDLRHLASRTGGFSPADLKSLLVTAQLTRLEKKLLEEEDKTMDSIEVLPEDVESALAETRPSLTQEQRLFYDVVYRRFRGESLSREQRLVANDMQKQKVTLA